jgi:rod shape determining protein RodA
VKNTFTASNRSFYSYKWFFFDGPLLVGLLFLITLGLFILYSATYDNTAKMTRQLIHFGLALSSLFLLARISPEWYRFATPWLFIGSLVLLSIVLIGGITGKGAQRWLNLGLLRFQPSELIRLSVPMMLAWYLHERTLPPRFLECMGLLILILIPALLTAKQPDLGTAILIMISGSTVLVLSGIRFRVIVIALMIVACLMPLAWKQLYPYQQQRILTFINPEKDPLDAGYHIIQSKTAIGSGGVSGKGWLRGTQSHLKFLPEESTDFIFAVCSEEFGLLGATTLIGLYLWITLRGLMISVRAQDTYGRLLAGALSLNFFASAFINIGMVNGILPIVGVPLPLISYGGTSVISWAASFGIIMAIHNRSQCYI